MDEIYKKKLKEIRSKRLLMEIFNTNNEYDEKLQVYERYEQNINYLLTLFKPETHDIKNKREKS